MAELPFKAKDLCSIIETCAKSGVSSLEFNGIKLAFGAKPEPQFIPRQVEPHEPDQSGDDMELGELIDTYKQLHLEEMAILQPEEFEALQAKDALKDAEEA